MTSTPAPTGRVEVEGIVTGMKQKHGDWKSPTGWKFMVTTDAGWRVWVTRPKPFDGGLDLTETDPDRKLLGVEYDDPRYGYPMLCTYRFPVVRGDRVRFTATLAPSDDPSLAWGSQPSNPEIVQRTDEPTTQYWDRSAKAKIMVNPRADAIQALADLAAADIAWTEFKATHKGHLHEVEDAGDALVEAYKEAQRRFRNAEVMANIPTPEARQSTWAGKMTHAVGA